jgi:hypothetical protein
VYGAGVGRMPPPGLWVRARKKGELASLGDSSVEQASRVMNAQEFSHGERCFPMADQQAAQLRERIEANALYNAMCKYAKWFASSLSAVEQAIELDPERVSELATPEDLAIGDSEATSPALAHFREIATTKTEENITHPEFVKRIEQYFGPFKDKDHPNAEHEFPKTIAPFALVGLHFCIRAARSRARSKRRKKSVKENRVAG